METRLVKLKGDFNNIITIRNTVKNVFDILQVRINKLKLFYSEFIKNSKNDMFVFGLDSFRFQSKLIDIEYDDMKRLFLAINNRMYCEYFKLHKIIVEYILTNIDDKKITDIVKVNNYPVYKDLEPYKEYKFETILDIHENILNLLNILMGSLSNKENELSIHKTKQRIGLNIDNFITTFSFNIIVLREKIIMFITYIEFFHKMHTKYLTRFSNKIQLMHTHINNDIKFDENMNKKDGEISEEMFDNNIYDNQNFGMNSDFNTLSDKESSITLETPLMQIQDYDEINSSRPSTPGSTSTTTTNNSLSNAFVNIIGRNRADTSDTKRNITEIIKDNVAKVSNIFQICKPKNNKIVEPKLSSEELNKMFINVNTTIEIPNDEHKENIGLFITDMNELKEVMQFTNSENKDDNLVLDEFINPNLLNEETVDTIIFTENYKEDVVIVAEVSQPIAEEAATSVVEEVPPTVVEEAATSVVEEVPPTVVAEVPQPIVEEVATSVVEEVPPTVVEEVSQPIEEEVAASVVAEVSQPIEEEVATSVVEEVPPTVVEEVPPQDGAV
jgi:hypothetical protein